MWRGERRISNSLDLGVISIPIFLGNQNYFSK